ncbi:MAG: hypothetical protein M3155_01685, partial [Actinomycetota bacterium]|nr:hypothetical protein [Actinomycetota bacterium]
MSRLDALYARLPTPLQHAAITAYGYAWHHRRQGGRFGEYRRGYLERDRYTAQQWREWQASQLRHMLGIAARSPHYRERWAAIDLHPSDLGSFTLDDLARLPPLTKEEVRRDPRSFCPDGEPGRGVSAWYTSGSTGTPLTTYHSRDDFRRGLAMRDARYETFIGVTHEMPHATFRGRVVEPDPNSKGPFHRYNHAERQIYFSPYHLGPRTASVYLEALWRHRPVWMDGYATSIHDLAHIALEQGLECPPLKAVITTAEPSSARLREDVRRAFGC